MGAGRRLLEELGVTEEYLKSCSATSDLYSCKITAASVEWRKDFRAGVLRKAFIVYHYMYVKTLVLPK